MSRALATFGALLLLAVTALLFCVQVLDPDVLMHLKTGEWILHHRDIPRMDIFSSNAVGLPWTTHEWLWQVLAYATFAGGKWKALYALRFALVIAALAFCVIAARITGAATTSALIAAILATGALATMAEIRPQLASYVFFAATLWITAVTIGRQPPKPVAGQGLPPESPRSRLLYLLPLLFTPWANMHGAVLLGFLILGCALTHAVVNHSISLLRRLAIITAACALAVLINPHGYGIYLFPFKVVGHDAFRTQIYEWSRPDYSRPFYPFWIFATLAIAVCLFTWRSISIFHWMLFVGFLIGAILSRRQVPFFALAAITPVAIAIDSLLARVRLPGRQAWLPRISALMVAGLMLPLAMTCFASAGRKLGVGLAPDRFPEVAANRLANLQGNGALLNDYNDGGYLIWRLHPQWPVIMDGRVDVYGPELVQQYERVWSGAPGWEEILEKWHVQAIVGRFEIMRAMPQHNLYHELAASPTWKLVYWDNVSQLFLRRGTTLEASMLKPYRVLAPGLSLKEMAGRLKSGDDWIALGADLRRSISEVPENRRAAALLKQYEAATSRQ